VESLNRSLRKVIKTRGSFPSDDGGAEAAILGHSTCWDTLKTRHRLALEADGCAPSLSLKRGARGMRAGREIFGFLSDSRDPILLLTPVSTTAPRLVT
jgi:hypothetical protein